MKKHQGHVFLYAWKITFRDECSNSKDDKGSEAHIGSIIFSSPRFPDVADFSLRTDLGSVNLIYVET